jgi:hypothetical protein
MQLWPDHQKEMVKKMAMTATPASRREREQ